MSSSKEKASSPTDASTKSHETPSASSANPSTTIGVPPYYPALHPDNPAFQGHWGLTLPPTPTSDLLCKALVKAQAEIQPAIRDTENPHFRRKYADLSAVVEAIRAPMAKYGLGFIQKPSITRDGKDYNVAVTTTIIHESGQQMESTVTLPVADPRPQAIGSAITYARRYGLSAMLGVVTKEEDDDDAESAEGRGQTKREPAPQASPPPTRQGGMKKSAELAHAARVKDLWKRAKAQGIDTDAKFNDWTLAVLNSDRPWDKWSAADFTALEQELTKLETEDIRF